MAKQKLTPPQWFPPEDGASQQLQDMRYVYMNGDEFGDAPSEKNQRSFMQRNPNQFHGLMAKLEAELAATKTAKGEGQLQKDGGSERIQVLIKDCLAKIKKEKA